MMTSLIALIRVVLPGIGSALMCRAFAFLLGVFGILLVLLFRGVELPELGMLYAIE